MKRLGGLLGLALAMLAGPAASKPLVLVDATPGYLYFNRPGADMSRHDSELKDCIFGWEGGQPVRRVEPAWGASNLSETILGAAVMDAMLDSWNRARYATNVENCMVVRGWRVVRVDPEQGVRLAALDRASLAQVLAPWVGADNPPGQIVRVWGNEADLPDTVLVRTAQKISRTLLSELALDPSAPPPPQRVQSLALFPHTDPSPGAMTLKYLTPIAPKELAAPPPGSAIFIVRLTGEPRYRRSSLSLDRAVGGAWTGTSWQPGEWTVLLLTLNKGASKVGSRLELVQAFAAPPGHWRVYGVGATFDYCMGAPGFDAKAGDVIFLGSIDFSGEPLTPDLDLAPAQSFLASFPNLARQLRPASWLNGDTWPCRADHVYALEFPGLPYQPGYAWGTAAGQK